MRLLFFLILIVALLASGCGGDDAGSTTTTSTDTAAPTTEAPPGSTTVATTTTSAATTTVATTTTTTTPPTVGQPQSGPHTSDGFPGIGEVAFLTAVRSEPYTGFVRIVFEFDSALPEFMITPTAGPILASPSGNPIDVAGQAFLEIVLAPASGVDLSGDEPVLTYEGPDRIPIRDEVVLELVKTEDFEAVMGWAIGLDAPVPFSFTTLDDPYRLVIDLHTGADS